jgi:uncharacterized surface protein with fasciclin (FAS1) repeats
VVYRARPDRTRIASGRAVRSINEETTPMKRLFALAAAIAVLAGPVAAYAAAAASAPAAPAAPAAPPAPPPTLEAHGDVVDTLKAAGQFTTLTKALDAANLTGILKGPGPITLMAPTDAAFAALPPGALDNLMKPENIKQLQALLIGHIINTGVPLSKIQGTAGPVPTGGGVPVQIDASKSPIRFNDSNVQAVANATNGTVYVLDKVLSVPATS